MFIQTELSARA